MTPSPPNASSGAQRAVFPVDCEPLATFAGALFRYASPGQVAQLRAFYDGTSKLFELTPVTLGPNLGPLVERAHEMAQRAADEVQPVVFCSPIAAFAPHAGRPWHARGGDVTEGLALSVECDIRPAAARETLARLLGRPTVVVASGGEWFDPETGEVERRLHVHFRLSEPATGDNLSQLRRARGLAAAVVGGDASNVPVAHPIRWPGTWHKKATPRLAEILELNEAAELELSDALEALEEAAARLAPVPPVKANGSKPGGPAEAGQAALQFAEAFANIAAGETLHKSIADLAARLVPCGLAGGAAVNMLRGAMEGLTPLERRDDRWRARYDDIPRAVSTAQDKYAPVAVAIDLWQEWPTPAFPLDTLPLTVRRFCELQARSSGGDVSGYAVGTLGAASGAINHSFTLKMKRTGGWRVRARLWWLLIGRSSTLKTPIISACLAPLRYRASELVARHREEMRRHKAAKKTAKRSGEPEPDEPPPPLRLLTDEMTVEKVGDTLSRQERGILLVRDELSGWLGGMVKYSNGGADADRSFWNEAYNGGQKHIGRVARGDIDIDVCSVSIIGGIQPGKLDNLRGAEPDGLLQRFLPMFLKPAGRSAEVDGVDAAAAAYHTLVYDLIDIMPCKVEMDDAALEVANAFQGEIHDMVLADIGESFSSFLGKLPGVHGSLMLVLHMLEHGNDGAIDPVSVETAEAAARILRVFAIPHALALYQATSDEGDWETLRAVGSHILTSGKARFTARDFTSGVRGLRGLGMWELRKRLSALVALGWLDEEETDGGQVKAWTTPNGLREQFAGRTTAEAERKARVKEMIERSASVRREGAER